MLLYMTIEAILSEIDAEIARLTQARKLLATAGSVSSAVVRRKVATGSSKSRKKRVLSPEARKRIADAQHRRWAAQKSKNKKEANKKDTNKKEA
jgi:hypothetical protein